MIVCYGILGIDHIYHVERFPERDGHARILSETECMGGEAANTAAALAGLGACVKLRGNLLGADRRGDLFRDLIQQYDLDSGGIGTDPGARSLYAVILSEREGTRTILGFSADLKVPPLTEEDLDACTLLSVDPFLGEPAVSAARAARERGIPVVSIELSGDHPLAPCCDMVINSAGFIRRHELGDPNGVAEAVLDAGAGTVIITKGSEGATAFLSSGSRLDQAAIGANVVDPTGAGDAFRAGVIIGMSEGWDVAKCVRFGSAMGSLMCERKGGSGHAIGIAQALERMGDP
jgi:sugar/nucleoside kinase (ribokinase family)